MPNKSPKKPQPFVTVGIDKLSPGAAVPGHRFDHGENFNLSGNLFVFDCPESFAAVLRTLADQYGHARVTLRITVEAFEVPSR